MAAYRDTQAELRIDTLEAKLAEHEAALHAREVELVEVRAELERARGDGSSRGRAIAAWRHGLTAVAAIAAIAMATATFARTKAESRRRLAAADSEIARLQELLARERRSHEPARDGDALPAAPASENDFDRGAAMRALAEAALEAKDCGSTESPKTRKIKLTFAPTGQVVSAAVQDTAFAATGVGKCVAARFRRVRVPPFEGPPVTVTKSFSVATELTW